MPVGKEYLHPHLRDLRSESIGTTNDRAAIQRVARRERATKVPANQNDDEVIRRLDLVIGLLSLAFDEPITAARLRLREDSVAAAILDRAADDWVASSELRASVSRDTGAAERTVYRRVSELLAKRALIQRGSGPSTTYRSTGLY